MGAHTSAYVHRYLHIEYINSFKGIDTKWGTFRLWNAVAHALLSMGGIWFRICLVWNC